MKFVVHECRVNTKTFSTISVISKTTVKEESQTHLITAISHNCEDKHAFETDYM